MMGFHLVFFIILAFIIVTGIEKYYKNENSPVISTKAKLIEKKRDVSINTDTDGVVTSNDTLILKFELDTGSEMKLIVGGRVFKNIPEEEWGILTFQGTRFLKFEAPSGIIER